MIDNDEKIKTVLIYSQSHLERDPRVYRQIQALSSSYKIYAFGKSPPSVPVAGFVNLSELVGIPAKPIKEFRNLLEYFFDHGLKRLLIIGFFYGVWRVPYFPGLRSFFETFLVRAQVLKEIKKLSCDLIIANDLTSLAVCSAGKGRSKLIYDAHEYSPGQHTNHGLGGIKNKYADAVLRRWLKHADEVMTIGYGISDLYKDNYGVDPVVITNSPFYKTLSPVNRGDGRIRLVHHGLAARQRHLESMIDVLRLLDERFSLDFYLVSHDDAYYEQLKRYASEDKRIVFNEPVSMQELPERLNTYDLGIRFYPAPTLNLQNGMPNKFFEFIQARLGVAVGPTPEAKRIVEKHGIGVVAGDFNPSSMAATLNSLSMDDIARFKQKSHECAYEFSADVNSKKIISMVEGLLS